MAKLRGVTSLVALVLLGFLIRTEAQSWYPSRRQSQEPVTTPKGKGQKTGQGQVQVQGQVYGQGYGQGHGQGQGQGPVPMPMPVEPVWPPYWPPDYPVQQGQGNYYPPPWSCDVMKIARVQCGAPGISRTYCEALNCCYDAGQCYYGNMGQQQTNEPVIQMDVMRYDQNRQDQVMPDRQKTVKQAPSWSCDVMKSARNQCGASGISRTSCEALKCCYDGGQCYYGNMGHQKANDQVAQMEPMRYDQMRQDQMMPDRQKTVKQAPSWRCDVMTSTRNQCGAPGISRTSCEALNCCYDGGQCYYGNMGHQKANDQVAQMEPMRYDQMRQDQMMPDRQKTVKQAPSWRCDVMTSTRNQCGAPGISRTSCEALNCCYDGGQCYYGNMGHQKANDQVAQMEPMRYDQMRQDQMMPDRQKTVKQAPSWRCDVMTSTRNQCGAPGISRTSCEALNCCYDGGQCYYGNMGHQKANDQVAQMEPMRYDQMRQDQMMPDRQKTVKQAPSWRCDVMTSTRNQCGAPGISRTSCEALNCCYDGGQCYYGNMGHQKANDQVAQMEPMRYDQMRQDQMMPDRQKTVKQAPSWRCDVMTSIRNQCGAPGISRTSCEALNCCYDGGQCYYGNMGHQKANDQVAQMEPMRYDQSRQDQMLRDRQKPPKQPHSSLTRSCNVMKSARNQCGAPGISRTYCEALNCCYEGGQCYHGNMGQQQNNDQVAQMEPMRYDQIRQDQMMPDRLKTVKQAPSWSCEVMKSARNQCGAPGISRTYCEALNCCYDGGQCYYGNMGQQQTNDPVLHKDPARYDQSQKTYDKQTPKKPHTPSSRSCDVSTTLRVPCGAPDITGTDCDALNCCYDGGQCYFGNTVTVQCTKDGQFIVVVAKDCTVPNIDLTTISLLGDGQNCKHVDSNSAFAIYQFPVTACGTVIMEETGIIVYENRMTSSYEVGVGPLGAITRDSSFDLLFQCRYTGTSVETLIVEVLPVESPVSVAALGPLHVELRLGNGQCFTKGCVEEDVAYSSFYMDGDYPVTKVLREPVYVEVQLMERTDPNLVLMLGRCWTTTSSNPHSLPQWDILINGCPNSDDRYLSSLVPVGPSSGLDFPSHYRRFIFKMFTFVDPSSLEPQNEQVYIHCSTSVCEPTAGYSCQPSCFRRKRDVKDESQKTVVPRVVASIGPVVMVKREE
ncbi:uncharacterized protein LOC129181055 [Dunckerocampus dactyliophorus]|uniref:uncharacterized protein LOC129181055 n=1 Tax=Dunckerocampus dactyliophorus TaxID=161453 RepID=UPI0024055F9F|nr:uncharacterized protein LOC129181055 [Dunckerocampus dactyliophorus]